jgi:hypothetical protein
MEVKHVDAFGDSLLVVQQLANEFQFLEGPLNVYLDMCLDIIASFGEFRIWHIPRHENYKVNMLAQQASVFDIGGHKFYIKENLVEENAFVLFARIVEPAQTTPRVGQATFPLDG